MNTEVSPNIPSDGDVGARVIGMIAKQAKVDPAMVTPASPLKDLGVESLEAIEMIFDIEEAFDITFPDSGTDLNSDTVQHLINAVQAALSAKTPSSEGAA
ncbi:phosphopantetheine-binding protein [Rhodanobacter denitrificans]|uniref:acyl carrier protein n=1 Tax=Rhodanobacter TaxID=75309 RepID=UPI000402354A|nr:MULTISPECIES: phosphopantetheine-binding protein [Rhodanobacter]UJM89025.1 phosphopantetheine-binding protein [Rhodanobacter denitrificans]